jgi:hypothetical protein
MMNVTTITISLLLTAALGMITTSYAQTQPNGTFSNGGHWTFHSGTNILCNDVTGFCMNVASGYICTKTATMSCD